MKLRWIILLVLTMVGFVSVSAQTTPPLPEKLKKLQDNYNTAIARANAPITATYLKELERLKADFTRAGDLKAALATDSVIKEAGGGAPGGVIPLASMTDHQFKKWLSTVTISEIESANGNSFTTENDIVTSTQAGSSASRTHPTATIEVGKLVVPFTSTTATIVIDPSMARAEVIYAPGSRFEATITPKKKKS